MSSSFHNPVGGGSKGEICACSKGETLQRIISQDFRPGILGWARRLATAQNWRSGWWLRVRVARWVGAIGPTAAQEVDLEAGIDPAAQVQPGGGRTRPDGRARLRQGFGPSASGLRPVVRPTVAFWWATWRFKTTCAAG